MTKEKFEGEISAIHLFKLKSTQEPILVLERSDKVILVTATQPPIPQCYSGIWGLFSFAQKTPPPNPNPYNLSIKTFTPADMPNQAASATSLRFAEISNECAESLQKDMLNAAEIFTKQDCAFSLIVKLLRKCTDNSTKESLLDDIYGRNQGSYDRNSQTFL